MRVCWNRHALTFFFRLSLSLFLAFCVIIIEKKTKMKILGIADRRGKKERDIESERPRMLQYACYYLGNKADAEDAVQDAFVRMHQRTTKGELEERNLIGYLYRTLSNLCVSRLREAGRLRMVSLEGQPEPMEPVTEIQEQEYQRICQLLDRIPPEQAEVIRLRYYGDKSFREIAEIFGLPITTVKSRFVYGLEKIRKELKVK